MAKRKAPEKPFPASPEQLFDALRADAKRLKEARATIKDAERRINAVVVVLEDLMGIKLTDIPEDLRGIWRGNLTVADAAYGVLMGQDDPGSKMLFARLMLDLKQYGFLQSEHDRQALNTILSRDDRFVLKNRGRARYVQLKIYADEEENADTDRQGDDHED